MTRKVKKNETRIKETSSEQPPPEAAPPSQQPEPPPPPGATSSQPPSAVTPSLATTDARPSSSSATAADHTFAPSSSQNPRQTPQSQPQLQHQRKPLRRRAPASSRQLAPFPHFVHHFDSASSSPSQLLSSPLSSSQFSQSPSFSHLFASPPRDQSKPANFPFGQSPSFSHPFASLPRVPDQSEPPNFQFGQSPSLSHPYASLPCVPDQSEQPNFQFGQSPSFSHPYASLPCVPDQSEQPNFQFGQSPSFSHPYASLPCVPDQSEQPNFQFGQSPSFSHPYASLPCVPDQSEQPNFQFGQSPSFSHPFASLPRVPDQSEPPNFQFGQSPSFSHPYASLPCVPDQSEPPNFQLGQSPAFSHPFASLPLVPDKSEPANFQARKPILGIHNIGMMGGSLSNTTKMLPGVSSNLQQRLGQPPLRAPSPSSNQAFNSQKSSGPTLLQGTSVASPSSTSPVTQPQLVSAQGKQMNAPSVLSTSHRPRARRHVLKRRPGNLQQPSHTLATTSPQQQTLAPQQQLQPQKLGLPFQLQLQQQQQQVPHQSQDPDQQNDLLRNQQQPMQSFGPSAGRSNAPQPGSIAPSVNADIGGLGNRILSKRSIHELVNQIDPSEKLGTEVEDVLIDIAEDFVESVATSACTLARHRNSSTLEARDILLHVESNWNIKIPGFSGDDIRDCKKQTTNDIHNERLAEIEREILATIEMNNSPTPVAGQEGTENQEGQALAPP